MEALLKDLKTAIFEVMEKMFFLLPDIERDVQFSDDSDRELHSIHIGIKGDPNYLLTFVFEKELAERMAIDILGIDDSEVNNELIQKCLKETANIYTGKFLLSFESRQDQNITLPSSRKERVFGDFNVLEQGSITMFFERKMLKAIIETIA